MDCHHKMPKSPVDINLTIGIYFSGGHVEGFLSDSVISLLLYLQSFPLSRNTDDPQENKVYFVF